MADYIYTMETRLTPDQMRGVNLIQDLALSHQMNVYLTGGTIRDILTGFPIHDIDITLQGNPHKLQKDLEKAGATVSWADEDLKVLYLVLPGNVRAEINMARQEIYDKPGRAPEVHPSAINDDLRRRDFTVNAMGLSLNPGSRGLLLDPFNGLADIELKLIRILHNYSFLEEPSRLIRATRFAARFHWQLEERTQARYDAAREGDYIQYVNKDKLGYETEQLAYEEDPLHIIRMLEKDGWLKVLHPHWSTAKMDTADLARLQKSREQMINVGMTVDAAPAVLYFLSRRMGDKEIGEIQRMIPRKDLVNQWKHIEDGAKDLAKRLTGKEAATPSRTWELLSHASPEAILFLELTTKQQAVEQKIDNFFGKWRQVREKLPVPEMAELLITPEHKDWEKLNHEIFLGMLDGKMRSHTELIKFLKPFAPPPPPPPPPPSAKRGRGAKAAAAAGATAAAQPAKRGRKPKEAPGPVAAAPESPKHEAKPSAKAEPKPAAKTEPKAAAKAELKHAAKPAAKAPAKPAQHAPKSAAKPAKKPAPKPAKKPAKPAKKAAKKK
ncbi:MAG: CCA tRNA nucleotidyltransferase [Terriglobia bacterium]|nr:CCA tRNA nucleotidyltransferase [Terriglobia bacterium]